MGRVLLANVTGPGLKDVPISFADSFLLNHHQPLATERPQVVSLPLNTMRQALNPKQKALEINLDATVYGSFAEIGAGQEVVRHFFQAGGAAGTVAKTMSAYDMKFSDDIYGREKGGRYVSESRILKMLEREYGLLEKRLPERCRGSRFFAFSNTVAAKSYRRKTEHHGWMGLRFQHEVCGPVSEAIIHVRMRDKENTQQQEALGLIGVNLLYACFHHLDSRETFVLSLMDNLSPDRLEIDMIRIQGSAFGDRDSRLFSLELVKRNFCHAVMFDAKGRILQASDALYKKHIVLCRGSYRPPTLFNVDMLEKGKASFEEEVRRGDIQDILVLPEISMSKLVERDGQLDGRDFLARVELLNALGHSVLISNYKYYWELSHFVSTYNRGEIAYVMGFYNLEEFFREVKDHEEDVGLLGALGMLVGPRAKLYIYPAEDEEGKRILTYGDIRADTSIKTLLDYLAQEGRIADIRKFDTRVFSIWSRKILKMIEEGAPGWEESVPEVVEKAVKGQKLFGAL